MRCVWFRELKKARSKYRQQYSDKVKEKLSETKEILINFNQKMIDYEKLYEMEQMNHEISSI